MLAADSFLDVFKRLIGRHHSQLPYKKRIKRWFKVKGDENLRVNYPLDANSIVFDIGAFKGEWAEAIFSRYGSCIYCFEPVQTFSENIQERFSSNAKITVAPYGFGAREEEMMISHDEDASSVFLGDGEEKIKIVEAKAFIEENEIAKIDLMKINIEGAEYDLIEHLIETKMIYRIKNLQVQFHDFFPDAEKRMEAIQEELSKTHRLTYQYKFIWENWEKMD